MTFELNWLELADAWAYAYGKPTTQGEIKVTPVDFKVRELMDVVLSGEGEHIWLFVKKQQQNTEGVAKQLARHAGVAYRDVGYSGLKDFFAITEQWFSIWKPKGDPVDWTDFALPGVAILQIARHNRKIRRGTHKANHFSINVHKIAAASQQLNDRCQLIKMQGVPNYFGLQRFGRQLDNMRRVSALFETEAASISKKRKDRHLRSLLLSSARSWLFNGILSERIKSDNWRTLCAGEPANLDGSASTFITNAEPDLDERLKQMDIHPTAPLFGEVREEEVAAFIDLYKWECKIVEPFSDLVDGLSSMRLKYQRRPLRMKVSNFEWQHEAQQLNLSFTLQKGQYATSVLREIVQTPSEK
jgi:tRNA pseudouridine13 synthase